VGTRGVKSSPPKWAGKVSNGWGVTGCRGEKIGMREGRKKTTRSGKGWWGKRKGGGQVGKKKTQVKVGGMGTNKH